MTMKGYKIIQFILTGKMHMNPNLRKLPKKELKDILESDQYSFIEDKYRYAKNLILENNLFRDTLNKLLNADIEIVDYSLKDTTKSINMDKYKVLIIYEFMKLIDDVI
jgi:tRNA(Ile)-lysidine synthase TilS/MesJ